jgi:hypothetical protein
MDYEGPKSVLQGSSLRAITQEDYCPSQSPFNLDTRREDEERPSEKGLILWRQDG